MTVLVASKKMKVTQALRIFAQEQAEKLHKLKKNISQVRIYLETIADKKSDSNANIVTYKVAIPGKDVIVKKSAVDMYTAISDGAAAALRKLRKVSEKRATLGR